LELAADGTPAEVELVEELGADAYAFCNAQLATGPARLVARVNARRAPAQGDRVALRPLAEEAHAFDPETGERL
jgi:multiple sugar transport system ATP-binding protein